MNRFDWNFDKVLGHEGGFVNDPADSGGATKWGISLRFYKTLKPNATVSDIRELTKEDAKKIYKSEFWDNPHSSYVSYDDLPLGVGEIVFNFAINMGAKRAHKLLQKAINFAGHMNISVDGVIGNQTLASAKQIYEDRLVVSIAVFAIEFYDEISSGKNKKFRKGWFYRAIKGAIEATEFRNNFM